MTEKTRWILILSLLTVLLAYTNMDILSPSWSDRISFEQDLDQTLLKISKESHFENRRAMARRLIEKIQGEIKSHSQASNLTEAEKEVNYAQLELTTHLRFLDIDIASIEETECSHFLKRIERIRKRAKKQKSSYRLIRALCNDSPTS